MQPNRLYFGDCLEIMQEYIADESVDLIYLDPPFNSKRIYNAFIGGSQWEAFKDTWQWYEAVDDFHAVAGGGETTLPYDGRVTYHFEYRPRFSLSFIYGKPLTRV